jgi:hypothetical protein
VGAAEQPQPASVKAVEAANRLNGPGVHIDIINQLID